MTGLEFAAAIALGAVLAFVGIVGAVTGGYALARQLERLLNRRAGRAAGELVAREVAEVKLRARPDGNVVPLRGKPGRPLAASATATGLPAGGTARKKAGPCGFSGKPTTTAAFVAFTAPAVSWVTGVIVAPAGTAATASMAAATSTAAGRAAPRVHLPTRSPANQRIRATPHPRDAYSAGA